MTAETCKSCFLAQTQKNVNFFLAEEKKNPYHNFVIMFSLGAVRELQKPRPLIKCPVTSISSSKLFYHKTNIMLQPFYLGILGDRKHIKMSLVLKMLDVQKSMQLALDGFYSKILHLSYFGGWCGKECKGVGG